MKSVWAPRQSVSLQVGRTSTEGAERVCLQDEVSTFFMRSATAGIETVWRCWQWRDQGLGGTVILIALAFIDDSEHGRHWALGPKSHN